MKQDPLTICNFCVVYISVGKSVADPRQTTKSTNPDCHHLRLDAVMSFKDTYVMILLM